MTQVDRHQLARHEWILVVLIRRVLGRLGDPVRALIPAEFLLHGQMKSLRDRTHDEILHVFPLKHHLLVRHSDYVVATQL